MVAENFDLLKSPNISPDDSREEFVCVFSLKLLHSWKKQDGKSPPNIV